MTDFIASSHLESDFRIIIMLKLVSHTLAQLSRLAAAGSNSRRKRALLLSLGRRLNGLCEPQSHQQLLAMSPIDKEVSHRVSRAKAIIG